MEKKKYIVKRLPSDKRFLSKRLPAIIADYFLIAPAD